MPVLTCETRRADAGPIQAVPVVKAVHVGTVRQRDLAPLAGVPVLTLTPEQEVCVLHLVLQPVHQRPVHALAPTTVARAPVPAEVPVVARVWDLAEVSHKSF